MNWMWKGVRKKEWELHNSPTAGLATVFPFLERASMVMEATNSTATLSTTSVALLHTKFCDNKLD